MIRASRMREILAKASQALLICGLILGIVWWVWPPALFLPELWFVVCVSVLANVFQPAYRPFESSRTAEDRGTARQILWTVYLTQILAVAELLWRRRVSLPSNWLTYGIALVIVLGLLLRTWAVFILGRWFTWNVTVQPEQILVTRGPYRVVRHPSYTGAWLMFVGSCALIGSYDTAVAASVFLMMAFSRRIKHEEALMRATFQEYDIYAKGTGAMFPGM